MVEEPYAERSSAFKPFQIQPNVPGTVRWLGTKTAAFYPDQPFPMATVFTVSVPKTAQSLFGRVLRGGFSWQFATPAPRLKRASFESVRIGSPALLRFNQAMDPNLAGAFIRVFDESAGGVAVPVRVRAVSPEEAAGAPISHAVALELASPLKAGDVLRFEINERLKGREGPLTAGNRVEFRLKAFDTGLAYADPAAPPVPKTEWPAAEPAEIPQVAMMGEGTAEFVPRILFFSPYLREGDLIHVPIEVKNTSAKPLDLTVLARTQGGEAVGPLRKILSIQAFGRGVAQFSHRVGSSERISLEYSVTADGRTGYAEMKIPVLKSPGGVARRLKGTVSGYRGEKLRSGDVAGGPVRVTVSPYIIPWLEGEIRALAQSSPSHMGERVAQFHFTGELKPLLRFIGESEERSLAREAELARWLERLEGLQSPDGGFKLWPADTASSLALAPQLLELFQMLEDRGQRVPEEASIRLKLYLLSRIPSDWDLQNPEALSDGLAVLTALGLQNPALSRPAGALLSRWQALPAWAKIELLDVYERSDTPLADREGKLADILTETVEKETEAYLDMPPSGAPAGFSQRYWTARLLRLTLKIRPGHAIVPKLAVWLTQTPERAGGLNASESLEALRALWQYHLLHGEVPERMRAMVQRGKTVFMEGTFKPDSEVTLTREIPAEELAGEELFVFQKDGVGTLYYQIEYSPKAIDGFRVEGALAADRRILPAGAATSAPLKAGDRVQVHLRLIVAEDARFVSVEDPLASVFEPLRPESGALEVDGDFFARLSHRSGQGGVNRWEFGFLPKGVYEWSYPMRLRHSGEFTVPPLKAYPRHAPGEAAQTPAERLVVQ